MRGLAVALMLVSFSLFAGPSLLPALTPCDEGLALTLWKDPGGGVSSARRALKTLRRSHVFCVRFRLRPLCPLHGAPQALSRGDLSALLRSCSHAGVRILPVLYTPSPGRAGVPRPRAESLCRLFHPYGLPPACRKALRCGPRTGDPAESGPPSRSLRTGLFRLLDVLDSVRLFSLLEGIEVVEDAQLLSRSELEGLLRLVHGWCLEWSGSRRLGPPLLVVSFSVDTASGRRELEELLRSVHCVRSVLGDRGAVGFFVKGHAPDPSSFRALMKRLAAMLRTGMPDFRPFYVGMRPDSFLDAAWRPLPRPWDAGLTAFLEGAVLDAEVLLLPRRLFFDPSLLVESRVRLWRFLPPGEPRLPWFTASGRIWRSLLFLRLYASFFESWRGFAPLAGAGVFGTADGGGRFVVMRVTSSRAVLDVRGSGMRRGRWRFTACTAADGARMLSTRICRADGSVELGWAAGADVVFGAWEGECGAQVRRETEAR